MNRQCVEVRERPDEAVVVEGAREAGRGPGDVAARQVKGEQVRGESRQRQRRQEHDVVPDQRVSGQPQERERLDALRQEVLRKRQCIRSGREDRRLPHRGPCPGVAAGHGGEVVADPRHDPGHERRIAVVAGQRGGHPDPQGPGDGDGRDRVGDRQDPDARGGGRRRWHARALPLRAEDQQRHAERRWTRLLALEDRHQPLEGPQLPLRQHRPPAARGS